MWAAGVQQDDLGWLHSHAEPEGSQDLGLDAKVRDMLFHAIANNSSANIRTGDNGVCPAAVDADLHLPVP